MDYQFIGIQIAVLLFALSFHEMAHAWAANKLGDPTARDEGRLTMNPIAHIDPIMTVLFPAMLIMIGSPVIFGAAKPVPVNTNNLEHPKHDHMWIAAAGPISNLILAHASATQSPTHTISVTYLNATLPSDVPGRYCTLDKYLGAVE